jgi:serine/threonine protein kinase/Tol biopolymer transport system component
MNTQDWQTVKQIFGEVLALTPTERAAYLDRTCSSDEELRSQVEKLLASYDSGFLEETAFGTAEVLAESELRPGQVIGRYRINELIGSGGMGQVFLADDTELNRPVAFKVLHRDVAEDQERVRRFIQEARAASALNHPNILTIHEIGAFEGCRFIVSEYVDGLTLREHMHQGLTAAESIDITCQIAAALQAAHSAGIVHRDIKPENVMLRKDGLVKVLDFGLAKLTEADDHPIDQNAPIASAVLTNPGLVMGTVAYMSPEQACGKPVDSRTDLWSLGVVFHEMLTGKSPFEGESVTDIITSILKTETTLPTSDNVPSELQPICRKALAKEKESRYQSAQDLLKDLQGEKKKMEYAIEPTPYVSLPGRTDALKTQLIRPRATLSAEYLPSELRKPAWPSRPAQFATLGAIALIVTVAIGLSVYKFKGITPGKPTPGFALINSSTTEKDLKFSKLPISGQANDAAISPDGKYVAYTDPKGMHLLELETSNDVVILAIPPTAAVWNLKFSPDTKFVYYTYADPTSDGIRRIPIQGGKPATVIEVVSDVEFGFSPDGSTLAFARDLGEGRDGVELLLANADGSNKRTLTKTAPGVSIVEGPMFSPDGKTIACATSFKEANSSYFKIVGFSLDGGQQRSISDKKWANMFGGVWLPNGNLIVSGTESSSETQVPPQLWVLSPDGQTRAFTSGLLGYQGLSATRDGSIILSNQVKNDNNLWLIPNNDTSKARQVTTSSEVHGGFTATPDGRIVFGSNVTGNIDLWLMNTDGSGRKRLTNEGTRNVGPQVSPDNKYIVFNSNRGDGKARLYRMGLDGQNVKRLAEGTSDIFDQSRFSGDGKWVYYIEIHDGKADTLKKVPIDGGEPLLVMSAPEDGEFAGLDLNRSDGRIACGLRRKPDGPWEYKIGILPANGKAFTRLIDLPSDLQSWNVRWMPDGRALATLGNGDPIEVWRIPIDGKGKPSKLTDFRTPRTHNFNWSFDGKFMLVTRGTRTSEPVLIRTSAN